MRIIIVAALCVVATSAEPPVDHSAIPSSNYGPPSNQYGPPQSRFNSHTRGSARHDAPSLQYGAPSQQYGAPSQQYGAPSQQYSAPSQQYGAPSQQYGAPSQQYGAPSQQYGAPSQQYGAPSQQYRAPSQQYSAPSQQYGAPGFRGHTQATATSFANAAARGQSNQYLPPGQRSYSDDDGSNGEPANYSFQYMVEDAQSGNDFGHREARQGDQAEGRYYVLLPDGRKQIVDYVADKGGYRPKISYEYVGSRTGAGGYDRNAQSSLGYQGGYPSGGPY